MNGKSRVKIIFVMCVVMVSLLCGCGTNGPITEFSVDNWLYVEPEQRYHMLGDLHEKVELIGMSSNEVEELLGGYSVSHGAYLSDNGKYDYHWGYMVRCDSWEGYEYLLIHFKDDVVAGYELVYGSAL